MRFGIGRLRFAIKSPSSIGLGFAQNGFQGVPDLHLWDPDAMLANRRFRAGYPLRGLCTADKGAVALGNVQEIRVQLFIFPYQNLYFVLSSCDIIGSNNLCAVF